MTNPILIRAIYNSTSSDHDGANLVGDAFGMLGRGDAWEGD